MSDAGALELSLIFPFFLFLYVTYFCLDYAFWEVYLVFSSNSFINILAFALSCKSTLHSVSGMLLSTVLSCFLNMAGFLLSGCTKCDHTFTAILLSALSLDSLRCLVFWFGLHLCLWWHHGLAACNYCLPEHTGNLEHFSAISPTFIF